jgi:hypothetical protein
MFLLSKWTANYQVTPIYLASSYFLVWQISLSLMVALALYFCVHLSSLSWSQFAPLSLLFALVGHRLHWPTKMIVSSCKHAKPKSFIGTTLSWTYPPCHSFKTSLLRKYRLFWYWMSSAFISIRRKEYLQHVFGVKDTIWSGILYKQTTTCRKLMTSTIHIWYIAVSDCMSGVGGHFRKMAAFARNFCMWRAKPYNSFSICSFHFNRIVPKRSVFLCFLSGSVELSTLRYDWKKNRL